MSQVSRTTAKTYFNTGDIPTEGEFANTLDSIPFFTDNVYTALSGTTWDGSPKRKVLTGNLSLTLTTTKRSGKLKIIQDATGGRTLTINSVSIPILPDPDSVSIVFFDFDDVASVYDFFVDTSYAGNIAGGGGDTTPPTITGMVASDAHTISITGSESIIGNDSLGNNGFSFKKNGTLMTITAISTPTSTVRTFTVSETMLNTDTITGSYDSSGGTAEDAAGNEVVSFTNQPVTNSIGGGGIDTDAQNYIDDLVAASANPAQYDESGLSALYTTVKASGGWSKIKRWFMFLYSTQAPNLINLKTPGTNNATLPDAAPTWSTTGASGFSETSTCEIDPHIATGDYVQDAVSAGVLVMTATTPAAAGQIAENAFGIGQEDNDAYIKIGYAVGGGTIYYSAMSADNAGFSGNIALGLDVITRGNNTTEKFYRNGTLLNTGSRSSKTISQLTSPGSHVMEISNSRTNYNRRAAFETNKIGMFFYADAELTSSEITSLTNAIKTYMTILGTNVIP